MENDITKHLTNARKVELPKGTFYNGVSGFCEGIMYGTFGAFVGDNDDYVASTRSEEKGYLAGRIAAFPTLIALGVGAAYLASKSSSSPFG